MSSSKVATTLDYTGKVYHAGVEPEGLTKTQNGPGMDKYRPTAQTLVPVQKDGAFDDEFAGSPLWSSTSSTDRALVPTGSEPSDLLSLTLGTDLPLDMSLCGAMEESSLDKYFFEQFIDLSGPCGDVPELDFIESLVTDICQPDVVAMLNSVQDPSTTVATPSQNEFASPNEVLSFLADVDSTSIVPQLPSPTLKSHDEITVIQTSDTVPSSPVSPSADNLCFDQALDFTELFKVFDNSALLTGSREDITFPTVQEPVAIETLEKGGKRKCYKQPSPLPAKRVRKADSIVYDSDSSESIPSPAVVEDKSGERRHKNNIASKVARAARKERENNLFVQEEELMQSNAELRAQLEELTREAEMLRKVVIERLSRGSVA